MLTENGVVDAVCRHLQQNGWHVNHRCTTNDRGVDVIATHPASGAVLRVEAKGQTSAK